MSAADLFDGDVLTVQKNDREADLQKRCIARARARDWWARKFVSTANRSVPDYILGKRGCTVFVEFKRKGGKCTEAQLEEHALMRAAGLHVNVIDNDADFDKLLRIAEDEMATLAAHLR